MSHEAAAISQMQKILKHRQMEKRRFEAELRHIEQSQRRARLNFERGRVEFLNLVRARREKWWQLDEIVRRDLAAKKEFRELIAKLEAANITNAHEEMSKRAKSTPRSDLERRRRVDFENRSPTTHSSSTSTSRTSSSPDLSNNDDDDDDNSQNDDQDDDDNVFTTSRRLTKRSQSSVALVRQPQSAAAVRTTRKVLIGGEEAVTAAPGQHHRPSTTTNLMRRVGTASSSKQSQHQQQQQSHQQRRRVTHDEDQLGSKDKEMRLALLIDRFIKRTPRSVERSFGPAGVRERLACEAQARIKSEIGRERENALKKDFRYFELVDCLSQNKT